MAQLVEQRIRNAWVAGSSPASGSLSWYPLDTSFFVLPNNALRPLYCLLAGRDRSLYYLRPNPPSDYWNAAQRISLL